MLAPAGSLTQIADELTTAFDWLDASPGARHPRPCHRHRRVRGRASDLVHARSSRRPGATRRADRGHSICSSPVNETPGRTGEPSPRQQFLLQSNALAHRNSAADHFAARIPVAPELQRRRENQARLASTGPHARHPVRQSAADGVFVLVAASRSREISANDRRRLKTKGPPKGGGISGGPGLSGVVGRSTRR